MNDVSGHIVDWALHIHRAFDPGLLKSVFPYLRASVPLCEPSFLPNLCASVPLCLCASHHFSPETPQTDSGIPLQRSPQGRAFRRFFEEKIAVALAHPVHGHSRIAASVTPSSSPISRQALFAAPHSKNSLTPRRLPLCRPPRSLAAAAASPCAAWSLPSASRRSASGREVLGRLEAGLAFGVGKSIDRTFTYPPRFSLSASATRWP